MEVLQHSIEDKPKSLIVRVDTTSGKRLVFEADDYFIRDDGILEIMKEEYLIAGFGPGMWGFVSSVEYQEE